MEIRKFKIRIEGKVFEAEVEEIVDAAFLPSAPKPQATPVLSSPLPSSTGKEIVSPMPGKIIAVKVTKGQKVNVGDVIIILEAMKMEQEIKASLSGLIDNILVEAGATVKKEQVLITIG